MGKIITLGTIIFKETTVFMPPSQLTETNGWMWLQTYTSKGLGLVSTGHYIFDVQCLKDFAIELRIKRKDITKHQNVMNLSDKWRKVITVAKHYTARHEFYRYSGVSVKRTVSELRSCAHTWSTNSLPWSEIILRTIPNKYILDISTADTSLADLVCIGSATTHLVYRSVMVKIYWFFFAVSLRGPIRSILTTSHSSFTCGHTCY